LSFQQPSAEFCVGFLAWKLSSETLEAILQPFRMPHRAFVACYISGRGFRVRGLLELSAAVC